MNNLLVSGGNNLTGSIVIEGAKNSALPILISSLMTQEKVILTNLPNIIDIHNTIKIIKYLGSKVMESNNRIILQSGPVSSNVISYENTKLTRASLLFIAPLLKHLKTIKIGKPGGDKLGDRSINIHLIALRKMGVDIVEKDDSLQLGGNDLHGNTIFLDYPSSTATELVMMMASFIEEKTILLNSDTKPEIVDLGLFLRKLGVNISGLGTPRIEITGNENLAGCEHKIIPDYTVAATYMIISAITDSDLTIKNVIPNHFENVLCKLKEMNIDYSVGSDVVTMHPNNDLCSTEIIATKPHPGIAGDIQPLFVPLLSICSGTSYITDKIWGPNRFDYIYQLKKLGGKIDVFGNRIKISQISSFTGGDVIATDIRGGAACLIAALNSKKDVIIHDSYNIDRGYSNYVEKLSLVGANIKYI